ncbi:ABC transporter ATP-binding protein [Thiohalobacter sp. COW1]|uniref:ABC-type dipeptide transporter n=1 Tax=Thiohalobacter thiocyanaticus TaxID=585455 RepID=A0A1Z4VS06_9GAMM|nr:MULTISPECIES: ABC transporter ATP-binding protein [Thiohalobacter]BAZ93984.1 peptide ABC transporter ATPase [Thiohalobacter thiocyanaticus]BCO30947.1 ABC transporter ATP-binding protein [Thiohalobacter sp. COW1]
MSDKLLTVRDLQVRFGAGEGAVRAVDGISLEIDRGETLALLGESGCGKSMTALALLRLLPQPAGHIAGGQVLLEGQDLLALPEVGMRRIRGGRIAMIFQEPMTSLNPVMTVGRQIGEVLAAHKGLQGRAATARAVELLDLVGIPDPARRVDEYPHQLSGGMKQRVMIAMALAGEPDLLIADEPTTALDVTIQAQVLELMRDIQRETGMAMLLITHDLGVVAGMADRVAVMYAGQIVEQADRRAFFEEPRHPYSRKLFAALPDMDKRDRPLTVIPGTVPPLNQRFHACRFAERCESAWQTCRELEPAWLEDTGGRGVRCHLYDPNHPHPAAAAAVAASEKLGKRTAAPRELLDVSGLKVHFPIHKGLFKRTVGHVYAVDDVDIRIPSGCTLALVGESGCGKTTVGKSILQLLRPTAGSVRFDGDELTRLRGEALRRRRREFQIIFQDPFSSMNPRMQVGEIIEEGMVAQGLLPDTAARERRVAELLDQVGLRPEHARRYPHEFSGGQRQRICVARALAVEPRLIICDEPTSALDVSVQAQILNLLKRLQLELDLAYLFITHNISVVAYLADRVAVMYLGRIVEEGPVDRVLTDPQHPYTQALLSAVPTLDAGGGREVIRLEGDIPSPSNPPAGCHFHPRCPQAMERCRRAYPERFERGSEHWARCWLLE